MLNKYISYIFFFCGLLVISQDVQAQTDLVVSHSGGQGDVIQAEANGGPFDVFIQVTNIGPTVSGPGAIEITIDPQVEPVNVVNLPPGWGCDGATTVEISCFNTAGVAQGDNFEFTMRVTSPQTPVFVNDALAVRVFDGAGGDINPSNDIEDVDIDFINFGPPGDLALNKTIAGGITTAQPGETIEYIIEADNTVTGSILPNASFTDFLPNDVTYVSHQAIGPNFNCVFVNQAVTCDAPTLPNTAAQDGVSILVEVTGQPGAIVNNTVNSNITDIDSVNDVSSVGFTIALGPPPGDLALNKTIVGGGTSFPQGSEVEYLIEATNTVANSTLNNVSFSDPLPAGVDYVSHQEVGTNFTCNFANQVLTCDAPSLPNSAAQDGVRLTVRATGQVGVNVNNTVSSNISDIDPNNDGSAVAFAIAGGIDDLHALKQVIGNSRVLVGAEVEFALGVFNFGTTDLTDVFVRDVLPDGLVFSGFTNTSGANCNFDNTTATIDCSISALNAGDEDEIRFTANTPNVGFVTNTVQVGSNEAGYNENTPADNTDSVNVEVVAPVQIVDLTLDKSANVDSIGTNEAFSYTLRVTNNGNTFATNVVLEDELPESLTLNSIDAPGWNCQTDAVIRCEFTGGIASGSTASLSINVTSPTTPSVVVNRARVNAAGESNPADNADQASVTVAGGGGGGGGGGSGAVDLQVLKSAANPEVRSGETLTWNVTVKNVGDVTATEVAVRDVLPTGFLTIGTVATGGFTCDNNNVEILCRADQMAPGETVEIRINGSVLLEQGLMQNQVSVAAAQSDSNASDNMASASVNVLPALGGSTTADVSVNIDGLIENTRQGSVLDLTFETSNSGPDAASDVVLEVNFTGLINELIPVSSGNYNCEAQQRRILCFYQGNFPANQSDTVQLQIVTEQVVQQAENIGVQAEIRTSSDDPDPGNNVDSKGANVSPTPDEETIRQTLDGAIGSSARQQTRRAIRNVASYCARSFFKALDNLCGEIFDEAVSGNGQLTRRIMQQITPDEVIGQSSSAAEIVSSQFANISGRLAELRAGGGSGISIAGLNARYGTQNMPLSLLAYLDQNKAERDAAGGGLDDFVSPWGFFINGTFSMGERDETGRERGFDFDTYGLTAGLDYRFNNKVVMGMALGYADFDSEISTQARLESQSVTLTGYGSFNVTDRFYMDARISYAQPEFDQSRRIEFTLNQRDINRVARGETDADQYTVAMSAGYQFNKNSWSFTPNVSARYIRTEIDGFTETGAGDFNFIFSEQEIESLVFSAGVRVSKAISMKNGVLTPQFDFNYNRETENDLGFIQARFIDAPEDEIFLIETDSPDKTYGSAAIGLVFISANGKQLYVNYRETIGLSGFSQGTINLGGRFEF
ncbi:autotransporter domain-containing protein [Marinicella sp. W31]|uniref:autotransporter domain-containing protein n=1 Tax=Marinicella sp. W31 TaxID=3023713 RepID=UPI00375654AA